MAPKRKQTQNPPPVKTVERVVRLEVTIEAPDNIERREWQSLESAIQSQVLKVATHYPSDKAITLADSFETVGITVKSVGPIEVGNDTPEYSEARRLPERWYLGEVESCASGIIADLLERPADEREEALSDMLHEAIDSRHCIIATAEARMVLAVSSNYDVAEDQGLEATTWEARAYYAMEADVREELDRRQSEWHPDHMPDPDDDDDGSDPRNPGIPFRKR